MSIAKGFNRFLCFKSQTAFGTKASGLTQTMIPLRGGGLLEPNPYATLREDSYSVTPPASHYFEAPKIFPWSASFLLINPTSGQTTIRDFLRTLLGRETTAAGPPLTKTYDIFDEVIDGGTDTGTVLYGRALTLHEQCDDSAGTKIYADEAQDAVVDEMSITWRSVGPPVVALRGMCSDFQPGASDISPTYPTGTLFTHSHVKDTTTAGLRIGAANPPVAADNVIFSQAVLTYRNNIRYVPFLGNGPTKQARYPTRDGHLDITLDVTMDVENAIASQWDADDASAAFSAWTKINVDFLTYADANNIFNFRASAATPAAFVRQIRRTAGSVGAMQYVANIQISPAALADTYIKLTTAS